MGIITRVRDVVNSNVNAALDAAENPEKLVKQMIREMEDTLVEIKATCAGALASQKKALRETARAETHVALWDARACAAVDRGRDELAREALHAKRGYHEDKDLAEQRAGELGAVVDEYKSDILKIEEKLGTALERRQVLVQRHVHARQRNRVQREIRRVDTSQVVARFERFHTRLDRAEATVEVENYGRPRKRTLEEEFLKIERDEQIEAELDALKEARRPNDAATA